MNYLSEILAFYDWLETNYLPSPAIALWHALMSIANKTGWQNEFTVAISVLEIKAGLNAQAVKRARNLLQQNGLIEWKSRRGNQSAVYHLNSLVEQKAINFVPQTVPQVEFVEQKEFNFVPHIIPVEQKAINFVPQTEPQYEPQVVPQYEPQVEPINKTKQNKIKQNKNIYPPSPLQRFEVFWNAYPIKKSRHMAERAYCQAIADGVQEEDLIKAAKHYAEECREERTEDKYIMQAYNFINNMTFKDYLGGEEHNGTEFEDWGSAADYYKQFLGNGNG